MSKLGETYAFPSGNPEVGGYTGMTLRQHYAGLAMQAEISRREQTGVSGEYAAKYAVACADALLAELEKE